MSGVQRPPRAAMRLLAALLAEDDREAVLGDLEEAFHRRATTSRARASAWLWAQVPLFAAGAVLGRSLGERRGVRKRAVSGPSRGDSHGVEVGEMANELVQATRRLARDWRFSASIVSVLGIGVGAALVAWSVVDRVLLRPLPYEEPERLAILRVDLGQIASHPGLAQAEVGDVRALDAFAGVESARAEAVLTLDEDGVLEPVVGARVTPGMFALFGVEPVLGRVPTEQEVDGRTAGVVLSHAFWMRRFGGDPAAVGRVLTLEGRDIPVSGVMPAGFALHLGAGADVSGDVDVWLPMALDLEHRNFWAFRSIARLADGVTIERANAELESLAAVLLERWPEAYGDARLRFVAHPLQDDLLRDVRPAIDTAVAGVLLLLLVSFANAASLMLGRQRAREADLAVRSALGAGRRRLVAVVLGESLVLALAAGVVGAVLAAWGVTALRAMNPPGVARWADLALDGRFLLAALALAAVGTMAIGLHPALGVSGASAGVLRGETLQRGKRGAAVRRALVAVQMSLAVVLVFGALVLGRSASSLARIDLGFDPSNVLTLAVPTDPDRFSTREAEWAFHRELRARLRALPGVSEAGAVSHLPLAGYAPTDAFSLPTADTLNWGNELANYFAATPGYLEAIRVELVAGRLLEDADLEGQRAVAVVDESLVAHAFAGEPPVGRVIQVGWDLPDLEIVGVIRHPRVMSVRAEVRPQIYVPYSVFVWDPLRYVVRSSSDPTALAASVRREVDALGAGRAVFEVRALDSYLAAATSSVRLTLALIVMQAVLTALLAALGLFTVIAYVAFQARRDTAVRSALGATRRELLEHHLRGGAAILSVAIPAGLGLSLAASRLLGSMVYGVSAADVVSLGVAAVVTAAVGLLATWLPARGAARADPMDVLRTG